MQNYLIADRPYTFDRVEKSNNETTLFDLSYLSVLTLQGEKTAEFLQGQFTCDVRQVNNEHMRQGALCNLKGRILALADVLYWKNFHLILPEDLQNDTVNSLIKPAMLSRVILEKNNQYNVYGLHHGSDSSYHPHLNPLNVFADGECCYYAITADCTIVLIPKNHAEAFEAPFKINNRFHGSLDWHSLLLRRKKVEIYPVSRGLFLPHRLDLQLSSYISFDKGCYKGQEIIARTHYRAKLKHQLAIFEIETPETLSIGQKLISPVNSLEMGELVDYSWLADNRYLIAASVLLEYPQTVLFENHQHALKLNACSL